MIAHKKTRSVRLGEHVTLLFEDELTVRYQIQEMLRIEKIFEEEGIQDELDAYNPLVPDGSNWKATMLIEYPDPDERKRALARLKGIEDRSASRSRACRASTRSPTRTSSARTTRKTSAVHFLRFELAPAMIARSRRGAALGVGVDHPAYQATVAAVGPQTQAQHSLGTSSSATGAGW